MNNINGNTQITDTKEKEDLKKQIVMNYLARTNNPFAILSASDVSKDLHIGINQAYDLFKKNDFPSITIGKRKVITLTSYLLWKIGKKECEV